MNFTASVIIAVAYLLGSIPFGYLIVRLTQGADVRETGSGGTGATNVSRNAGKWAGIMTLALDIAKGAAAIIIAQWFAGTNESFEWLSAACGFACIVGHIFPVWLKFRGGKGVATGLGVFIVLSPVAMICSIIIFIIVFKLTRYVSLASIIASLSVPLIVMAFQFSGVTENYQAALPVSLASSALLIMWMHRANIRRLLNGTESKFAAKVTSDE